MPQTSILSFNSSHVGLAHNLVALFHEHRVNFPAIGDMEKTTPALNNRPQGLEGDRSAVTDDPR